MGINKLVFAALTAGCLAAAGLGGYLAVRFGQPAASAVAPVAAPAADPASATTPGAVTESEGVISPEDPAPPAPKSPAPPVASSASERRSPSAARPRPTREPAAPKPAPREPERRASATPARPPAQPIEPEAPPMATNGGSMWEVRPSVTPEPPPVVEEPPPPPPAPEFVELQVPADSVLGLQVDRTVSSDTARIEDKVSARVTRDVRVGGQIAIPAGSIVTGSVTDVDRGGKMKGKARLAVRFHTVTLADGSQLAIRTDTVVREGSSPSRETAAKVGGATIGGAILGAILGGGRGAAIGAGVGAAGGTTAAAMSNERNPATLPGGTSITVRVQEPVNVTIQKE